MHLLGLNNFRDFGAALSQSMKSKLTIGVIRPCPFLFYQHWTQARQREIGVKVEGPGGARVGPGWGPGGARVGPGWVSGTI